MTTVSGRDRPFNVHLIHAEQKHNITLDVSHGPPTVQQFAAQVAGITQVPIDKQRLIFKGRSLTNMTAPLQSYGMKSGSKVMVLGSKANLEDDDNIKALSEVNVRVSATNEQLDEIIKQYNDISKNMLTEEPDLNCLNQLDRQLAVCSEHFTRQLEQLDGLTLAESTEDVRSRRKSIVLRIQSLLEQSDILHNAIVDYPDRRQAVLDKIRQDKLKKLAEQDEDEYYTDGEEGSEGRVAAADNSEGQAGLTDSVGELSTAADNTEEQAGATDSMEELTGATPDNERCEQEPSDAVSRPEHEHSSPADSATTGDTQEQMSAL